VRGNQVRWDGQGDEECIGRKNGYGLPCENDGRKALHLGPWTAIHDPDRGKGGTREKVTDKPISIQHFLRFGEIKIYMFVPKYAIIEP